MHDRRRQKKIRTRLSAASTFDKKDKHSRQSLCSVTNQQINPMTTTTTTDDAKSWTRNRRLLPDLSSSANNCFRQDDWSSSVDRRSMPFAPFRPTLAASGRQQEDVRIKTICGDSASAGSVIDRASGSAANDPHHLQGSAANDFRWQRHEFGVERQSTHPDPNPYYFQLDPEASSRSENCVLCLSSAGQNIYRAPAVIH